MIFGRVAQDLAQLAYRRVQTVFKIDKSISRPESLVQGLAAYQIPPSLEQSN
jgi:hypothetical protein